MIPRFRAPRRLPELQTLRNADPQIILSIKYLDEARIVKALVGGF
jgi:hypothetical protein